MSLVQLDNWPLKWDKNDGNVECDIIYLSISVFDWIYLVWFHWLVHQKIEASLSSNWFVLVGLICLVKFFPLAVLGTHLVPLLCLSLSDCYKILTSSVLFVSLVICYFIYNIFFPNMLLCFMDLWSMILLHIWIPWHNKKNLHVM